MEADAVAAFERELVKLKQGTLTLYDRQHSVIKHSEAVPIEKRRRPPRGGWGAGPGPTREELKYVRKPSMKRVRAGHEPLDLPTKRDK